MVKSKKAGEIKMPIPMSKEIRELILYHKENGAKNREIAKWLRITERSVERIVRLYREQKTIDAKPHNKGRKPAFCDAKMEKIRAKIAEQPDITLYELEGKFSLSKSISALSRKLTKVDLSFKKRRCFQRSNCVPMFSGFGVSGSNI
jgi:transposase